MANSLIFAGHSSREYGVVVSGPAAFNAPERDVTAVPIPGRSGDLLLDNRRWKNIPIRYPAFVWRDFQTQASLIRAWLSADAAAYHRLEDDYDPTIFRMARFVGPLEFLPRALNSAADFAIFFDAKPQRFLKSGEAEQTITNGGTIANPTDQESAPLIGVNNAVTGAVLTVNGIDIEFAQTVASATIDCAVGEAMPSSVNGQIYCPIFPTLSPGLNTVSWTGTIGSVKITPRWWTL